MNMNAAATSGHRHHGGRRGTVAGQHADHPQLKVGYVYVGPVDEWLEYREIRPPADARGRSSGN